MKAFARAALLGLAAGVLAGAAWAAEPVKVAIDAGTLVGTADGPIVSFKGVPFAAPPVGPLRWAPPGKAAAWTGARAADQFGPACPQKMNADGKPNAGGASGPISEDCLTLNV